MRHIVKIAGTFSALEETVSLSIPGGSEEVALRLYEEGLELSIFVIVDPVVNEPPVLRNFLLTANAELPADFVKYVGSLLFLPFKTPAYVLEVGPIPEPPPTPPLPSA